MPKKAASKAENKVTLKITLTPEEHKKVKMAAAEREVSIADFLRDSAVDYAEMAVLKYYQREIAVKRPHKSKSSGS